MSHIYSIYDKDDAGRCITTLRKTIPYLNNRFFITGGIATKWYFLQHGIPFPLKKFNDIDIALESIDDIKPEVASELLIAHYHTPKGNKNFIVQLADRDTEARVDLFPALNNAMLLKEEY